MDLSLWILVGLTLLSLSVDQAARRIAKAIATLAEAQREGS